MRFEDSLTSFNFLDSRWIAVKWLIQVVLTISGFVAVNLYPGDTNINPVKLRPTKL